MISRLFLEKMNHRFEEAIEDCLQKINMADENNDTEEKQYRMGMLHGIEYIQTVFNMFVRSESK